MAVIGYIRVSTIDQNSDLQRNALTSANCDRIFEDRMSESCQPPRSETRFKVR